MKKKLVVAIKALRCFVNGATGEEDDGKFEAAYVGTGEFVMEFENIVLSS